MNFWKSVEALHVGKIHGVWREMRIANVVLKHHKNILIQKFKQLSLELIYNVNAFIFQNLKHDLILCFAWGYFFLIPLTYEIVNASNNFSELLCPPYLWDCTSSNILIPSHIPQSCFTSKYLSISSLIPTIFPLSSVTTSILNIPLLPFFKVILPFVFFFFTYIENLFDGISNHYLWKLLPHFLEPTPIRLSPPTIHLSWTKSPVNTTLLGSHLISVTWHSS